MNERIKELELEAAYGIIDPNEPFTAEEFRNFTKKFAELIVRECQLRVEQYINECGEVASMPDTVIMKHFGVEE